MTLYIEVEGKPVNAKDVVWLVKASCGCFSGVTSHNSHAKSDDEMLASPGQVLNHFYENRALRERAVQDGESILPATWDYFRNHVDMAMCPHTPKWGVHVDPPEGMEWATTDSGWGRRTFKQHVVASSDVYRDGSRFPASTPPALCGWQPKRSRIWYGETHYLSETVTCRKCEAAVSELGNANA